MTQAHWIRDARYRVVMFDADGEVTGRAFYAANLAEVQEELAAGSAARADAVHLSSGRVISVEGRTQHA